jgi:hypothetical protein
VPSLVFVTVPERVPFPVTVKFTPLLGVVPTFTTTEPEVALVGTVVEMDVLFQLLVVAVVPLNVTVPVDVPKFAPLMVTAAPAAPDVTERFWIVGNWDTVNVIALLVS